MIKYALRMYDQRLISSGIRNQLGKLFINNSFDASKASRLLRE